MRGAVPLDALLILLEVDKKAPLDDNREPFPPMAMCSTGGYGHRLWLFAGFRGDG
jgi:hypothetical protein